MNTNINICWEARIAASDENMLLIHRLSQLVLESGTGFMIEVWEPEHNPYSITYWNFKIERNPETDIMVLINECEAIVAGVASTKHVF